MQSDLEHLSGGLLMRGILAILFGIAAVFWPGETLIVLVYLFATFILVGGLAELVVGIGRLSHSGESFLTRSLTLIVGALQIGVGVYLLRHIHVSFATLILLIGFTLIVRGVIDVVEGLFEGGPGTYRTLMVVVGLLAVLAGIIVLFQPVASGVAFVWIIGIYALVSGPLFIAGALEARNLSRATQ